MTTKGTKVQVSAAECRIFYSLISIGSADPPMYPPPYPTAVCLYGDTHICCQDNSVNWHIKPSANSYLWNKLTVPYFPPEALAEHQQGVGMEAVKRGCFNEQVHTRRTGAGF